MTGMGYRMHTYLRFALACAFASSYGSSVRAADSPLTAGLGSDAMPAWLDAAPPSDEREWYGWQTLAGDAYALAAVASAPAYGDSGVRMAIGISGLGSYFLTAPISHAAHGRWGAALGSLGLRTLPILTLTAYGSCEHTFAGGNCTGLVALLAVTLMMPIVVDSAILAYDDPPATREARTQLSPWLTPESGGVVIGHSF